MGSEERIGDARRTLAAIEMYTPCYFRDLLYEFCRDNRLPNDFLMEARFREALIDLASAGFIRRSPWIEITDLGREALATARKPPVQTRRRKKRWWRR